MDSPFVQCGEEDGYPKRLANLFMELHWRQTVPTVMAKNLLCLPEDFGHVYFVAIRAYCSREFSLRPVYLAVKVYSQNGRTGK